MSNFQRLTLSALAVLAVFPAVNVSRLSAEPQSSAPTYTADATSRHDGVGQTQSDNSNTNATQNSSENPADDGHLLHKADGRRQPGVAAEAYAVAPGTKFLVSLEDDLSSKGMEENKRIRVTTLEPLEAGSGIYLPAGAAIEGRVTRVESAGVAGRAKILLTFDYIHTRFGKLPRGRKSPAFITGPMRVWRAGTTSRSPSKRKRWPPASLGSITMLRLVVCGHATTTGAAPAKARSAQPGRQRFCGWAASHAFAARSPKQTTRCRTAPW